MTEDDTFNALRQAPFESVLLELGTAAGGQSGTLHITKSAWSYDNENLLPFWIDFFKTRGWTVTEFEKECRKK